MDPLWMAELPLPSKSRSISLLTKKDFRFSYSRLFNSSANSSNPGFPKSANIFFL